MWCVLVLVEVFFQGLIVNLGYRRIWKGGQNFYRRACNTFHLKSKAIIMFSCKNFATLLDPPLLVSVLRPKSLSLKDLSTYDLINFVLSRLSTLFCLKEKERSEVEVCKFASVETDFILNKNDKKRDKMNTVFLVLFWRHRKQEFGFLIRFIFFIIVIIIIVILRALYRRKHSLVNCAYESFYKTTRDLASNS